MVSGKATVFRYLPGMEVAWLTFVLFTLSTLTRLASQFVSVPAITGIRAVSRHPQIHPDRRDGDQMVHQPCFLPLPGNLVVNLHNPLAASLQVLHNLPA